MNKRFYIKSIWLVPFPQRKGRDTHFSWASHPSNRGSYERTDKQSHHFSRSMTLQADSTVRTGRTWCWIELRIAGSWRTGLLGCVYLKLFGRWECPVLWQDGILLPAFREVFLTTRFLLCLRLSAAFLFMSLDAIRRKIIPAKKTSALHMFKTLTFPVSADFFSAAVLFILT